MSTDQDPSQWPSPPTAWTAPAPAPPAVAPPAVAPPAPFPPAMAQPAMAPAVSAVVAPQAAPLAPPATPARGGLYLVGQQRVAVLPVEQAAAMVGIAKSIEDQGKTIKQADRLAELIRFAARLREVLLTARSSAVRLDVDPAEEKIATFLVVQTRARASLAWRMRQVCQTCGLTKLTNPDYEKTMKRRRTAAAVVRGAGLTFATGGAAPIFMFSSLLGFVKMDPDYVCSRCQGLAADESIVVFCPQCRAQRDQAVLKRCPKCDHDFLAAVDTGELWQPVSTVAVPAAPGRMLAEFRLEETPTALAFMPGGHRLVTASTDRSIQLWDAADPQSPPRLVWSTALAGLVCKPVIAPGPDGNWVAVARNLAAVVRLLRTSDGAEVGTLNVRGGVTGLAASPCGRVLAVASSNLDLWELSGRKIGTLPMGVVGAPSLVAFSPDGTYLASDSWRSLMVFRAFDGVRVAKIPLGGPVGALAWGPVPNVVAVGVVNTVRLLEVPSARPLCQFALDARVSSLALSADGRHLAAASDDRSARVFKLDDGTEVARISRPCPVTAVAFAADGRLAVGDEHNTVQFWRPPTENDSDGQLSMTDSPQ